MILAYERQYPGCGLMTWGIYKILFEESRVDLRNNELRLRGINT